MEWFENNGISTLNWPSQSPRFLGVCICAGLLCLSACFSVSVPLHLSVLLSLFCIYLLSLLIADWLYLSISSREHSYFRIFSSPSAGYKKYWQTSPVDPKWCNNKISVSRSPLLSYLPNPSARAGYDTRSLFLSGV